MVRLFRIIGSSDPEWKLNGAGTFLLVLGYLYLGVRDRRVLPDRAYIFRSGSFIAPGRYSFALVNRRRRLFLGGVLLTELPQCGLECSHPALPEREITQVNKQGDRLVVFVGLPLLDVRCNLIPSCLLALPQLVQI